MYKNITPEMTIGELIKSGVYGEFADYIFTDMTPDHWNNPLSTYGFDTVGFTQTLHRMEELAKTGKQYVYYPYSEEERQQEWDKARTSFLHFPGPTAHRPYVVVIPGGGFNRQWGLIEGMAIATELNLLGYSAFVLFYRTKQEPLMPKPIEDMYATIRYIEAHAEEFGVQAGHYMIGGFSAGATIAGEIGSTNYGWQYHNVPKPEAIFLGYTAVRMKDFYYSYESYPTGHPAREGIAPFLRRIGGPEFTLDSLAPYVLGDYMDASYPPVFLTANEDDGTVPFSNSLYLEKRCIELSITHQTRFGKTGGHSYGLGIGLEVEGWLKDAVAFWEHVSPSKK